MPHQIERIIAAFESSVWAMQEEKLTQIAAFLDQRANADLADFSSVRAAFVPKEGPEIFRDTDGTRLDVDGIRILPLFGVLTARANMISSFSGGTSMEIFGQHFRVALADDSVKTILIHVDSPGGEAQAVSELSQLIRSSRGVKRIVSFTEGVMASGALWIGTAADVVVATKSAQVGSQGVFRLHSENSKAAEEAGVKRTVIRAGENKIAANGIEPLTDKSRASLQKLVNAMNEMFVADMALNRGVTEEFVLDRFGRGSVFFASEARERGLVDDVLLFEEFIDQERRLNANHTVVSTGGSRQMQISQRVKAALFANGCIESMEACDEVCVAYLRALTKARNVKLEDQSDDNLVRMVAIEELPDNWGSSRMLALEHSATLTAGIDAHGNEYVAAVTEPIRSAAIAEERTRIAEITAIGTTLGISDTEVLAAHTQNLTVDKAREKFNEILANANQGVSLVPGDASIDKLTLGVTGVLVDRSGFPDKVSQEEREYGYSLVDCSLIEIAKASLQTHGLRPSGDRQTDARAWLALGTGQGGARVRLVDGPGGLVHKLAVADDPVVSRRGDFPDALSNLMGRMLDIGYAQAPQTFQVYTKSIPDLPDFRPKTFLETAIFQELDVMGEDDPHQQLKFENAIKAVIEVVRYGNKIGLTIEMVVDDDLGVFSTQLQTLASAAGDTIDNSCRTMLTSNPVMLDGTAMFTAGRGNLVASGAVPSSTSAKEHRRLHRLIKGYGSTRPQNRPPTTALVPAKLEEDALQTFTFFGDPKVANTDSAINTHRGTITPTIDSMLDDFDADAWYTFTDTRLAPLAKAHLRGAGGERGTRSTWSDPDTGSRYVALDMTLGLTPLNFRGAVLNPGV